MSNIISIIMVILMGLLGGVTTVAITLCIPVVIVQKIYGKVKYGKSLYD